MHFKLCREDFPFSISVFTLAYYLNLETGIVRLTDFYIPSDSCYTNN